MIQKLSQGCKVESWGVYVAPAKVKLLPLHVKQFSCISISLTSLSHAMYTCACESFTNIVSFIMGEYVH